jgi:predicted ATP-dependent serine protease
MAYFCKDCSYSGVVSGQLGECPACGSYNMERRLSLKEEEESPAKWRIVVLVALWGIFIALVIGKLVL